MIDLGALLKDFEAEAELEAILEERQQRQKA
jgi:hypothetical protein